MIQKLINDSLLEEQNKRKDRESSGKISPSSLGWCFRRQVYKLTNAPESDPPDERALRVFKCGKLFHDFVQGYIPKDSVEILVETDDIKGYADIVGKDTVYDVKSQHSKSFWYMNRKEDYDVKKEKYSNWLQLACYGKILKKEKLCLVIISKDDLCINEYAEFTKDWIEELDKEIQTIKDTLKLYKETNELPERLPRLYSGKECKWCGFKTLCGGVNGDKRDIDKQPISDSE
jgi:hypothetical protein